MAQTWRPQREATATARKLWQPLQGKHMADWKFPRQHRRGPYIATLCGLKPGLIIEHDGGPYTERLEREAVKRAYLVEQAYGVIGFWNAEVNRVPTEVWQGIYVALTDM
ncbi:MAG: DUF559 domain-containing protein [Acetobacteraceae bacterium]|nr:DUF559 domain-containing protein [Acetobacteraceae bacterium]